MDDKNQSLLDKVANLTEMSEDDARRIVADVYRDGIVDRAEAEALYRCHPTLKHMDQDWSDRFMAALRDYLVQNEAPHGWVSDEEADWLLALTGLSEEEPSLFDIDLTILILRTCEGAPEKLADALLQAIAGQIRASGFVEAEMVERLRSALFAPCGHGGLWVTRTEATRLFEINDAVAFARNDPSWNDFFARAIGNHLMARAHPDPQSEADALAREAWLNDTSSNPGGLLARLAGSVAGGSWFQSIRYSSERAARKRLQERGEQQAAAEEITSDEQDWVKVRLGWDKKVSPAERALIEFLKQEVPGFAEKLTDAA